MHSIFDYNNEKKDILEEAKTLEYMFSVDVSVRKIRNPLMYDPYNSSPFTMSFEKCIDEYLFPSWPNRDLSATVKQYREKRHIADCSKLKKEDDTCFMYLEFLYNMMKLLSDNSGSLPIEIHRQKESNIIENINAICSSLNFELRKVNKTQYRLFEIDSAITSTIKLVQPTVASAILDYNYYFNRNCIDKKRKALKVIADDFEVIRSRLESNNLKSLCTDLGFILNNLSVRHNNSKNPSVKAMKPSDFNTWYDYAFRMYLQARLSLEKTERQKAFDVMKDKVTSK